MPKSDPVLEKMRDICLSLPDTKLTWTWGKPHFRVGDKIFCGCGEEKGRNVVGFKLEMDHAATVVKQARFWRAPYVGHKGWVSMDADSIDDWDEVRAMIVESYRLIAPKRTLAKLAAADGTPARKTTRSRKVTTRRVVKKTSTRKAKKKPATRKTTEKPASRKADRKPVKRKSSKKVTTRKSKKTSVRKSRKTSRRNAR